MPGVELDDVGVVHRSGARHRHAGAVVEREEVVVGPEHVEGVDVRVGRQARGRAVEHHGEGGAVGADDVLVAEGGAARRCSRRERDEHRCPGDDDPARPSAGGRGAAGRPPVAVVDGEARPRARVGHGHDGVGELAGGEELGDHGAALGRGHGSGLAPDHRLVDPEHGHRVGLETGVEVAQQHRVARAGGDLGCELPVDQQVLGGVVVVDEVVGVGQRVEVGVDLGEHQRRLDGEVGLGPGPVRGSRGRPSRRPGRRGGPWAPGCRC